jgi:ABC-type transport system involved in Fe-S cluster assembly fused permease/ATPase subunit
MNDASYLIILFLFCIVIILIKIWRTTTKRRQQDDEKEKAEFPSTLDMEKEFDDDPIINPGYSSLKSNIFHKDRNDNDN